MDSDVAESGPAAEGMMAYTSALLGQQRVPSRARRALDYRRGMLSVAVEAEERLATVGAGRRGT